MIRTFRTISAFCCVLLISAMAFGQGGAATGDLHVTVKDPKGNLVTNATVTVRDVAKGVERTATSNGEGGYSAQLLPPGTYTVTVEAAGFSKVENSGVVITVGGLVELPITLSVAAGTQVVEVSAQAALVETSRSSTTDTIGQRRIDNLPINGRNYINFTLTDSQVVRDNAPNTGAAPTSGLNMSGQRARSNLVNVDGADATDNSVNGVRSTVSQEAVQEFQIITNSYAAEYGRAAGGVVNIITRSGSNDFHGDLFGYLRNRNFQAVNPFSTVPNPAYTRVQGGIAFGGPIKKDKTFYYFAYEVTRRHETGFSSVGEDCLVTGSPTCFGLSSFDTTAVGLPFGSLQLTPGAGGQIGFLTNSTVLATEATNPAYAQEVAEYAVLAGASSGQAVNGAWPSQLVLASTGGLLTDWAGFPTTSPPGSTYSTVPTSYQTLASQIGNFPVFEGTSVYSLRIDHNINASNRLMLRVNVSPSTITGIEVGGQDQPFGQNAYSRTSQQTFRDVAGTVQDTLTIGTNKVNEFRFQYARRGLSYFYNTAIPGGSDPAVNIPGYAYFGREPYSYIQRTEQRYQFTDNFSWTIGRHDTKFGVDVNYLPLTATFTVNYGGVYDMGSLSASSLGFVNPAPGVLPDFPALSPVQAYGAGIPQDFVQGIGSPSDSFHNIPIGAFWQDSWRVSPNVTLNYGLRYDIEIPPTFAPPSGLALAGYNILGLQKGIQTATHNFQPRLGLAWDPKGDGKTVVRASYGIFYDHPLLGLYFLGDASDGSTSGQLAFAGGAPCSATSTPYSPSNLNASSIFTGTLSNSNCMPVSQLNYLPNQQQFQSFFPVGQSNQSLFLEQQYLTNAPAPFSPASFPLAFQPFGYPQAKGFVYAYAQQANVSVERDLGGGFALNLAYNFNGGRHLNRPINANAIRGDLLTANWQAAYSDPNSGASGGPLEVGTGALPCNINPNNGLPWVSAALTNFFRPGGINPSIANFLTAAGAGSCVTTMLPAVMGYLQSLGYNTSGFNNSCNAASIPTSFSGCIPFGDMDANYSNGSSIYHGFSVNLRKRFTSHYEFLASYTWSHAIDDSTDLQSTLTPQDSYYPGLDRSTSLFDQRHRLVFSGVYQSGKLSGSGFVGKFFSDWTVAPILEVASGRPFNIITGSDDNFQLSSLTGRPNIVPAGTPTNNCGYPTVASQYSQTGFFQEPCFAQFTPSSPTAATFPFVSLLSLDGNLSRNAGIQPWTVFDDMRIAKRIYFGERLNLDLIADMFNIANKENTSAVSPLFTNAGQATAAYDPRQFQFAMRINW
ncbi:MAG TPA: carboxypeptidase regulatory-like domain-containing protein [Terriglobales bacterium]|nr:carboxypeptidase regulatory-like domain-containing protein [Terriglobales bacterium]